MFFEECLELIFPFACPHCEIFCPKKVFCSCEKMVQKPFIEWKWLQADKDSFPIFSLFSLTDSAKEVLHKIKYQNQVHWLGPWILPYLDFPFLEKVSLVPVPSTKMAWLKRGFNPAEEISKIISEKKELPINTSLLFRKNWSSRPQAGLNKEQRLRNHKKSFYSVKKWTSQSPIILIDDVVTTGATLKACFVALRKKGHKAAGAWTLFQA